MRFTNASGLPASWTAGFRRDGRELLVVIAKATYTLPTNGDAARPALEPVPLVEADTSTGEPGLSAPHMETDFAHGKPACDVLLVGSAHAPPGQAVTRLRVGLRVGPMAKQFDVVGPRHWLRRPGHAAASAPEPFSRLPVGYDHAFGGTDLTREADGQAEAYLRNPVGRGYWRHTDHLDGQPLPTSEAVGEPVTDPAGAYAPQAFSPLGRNWDPRRGYAGTYDRTWIETTAPLWPEDFDERYFQAAPADQQVPYLQGGEAVTLLNLTRDGRRDFVLPPLHLPVTFVPHRGRDLRLAMQADTLVFEPDADRFTVTWRHALPLGRSVFDVRETVVGTPHADWGRERRFPGKPYYRNVAEAVRARRGRR